MSIKRKKILIVEDDPNFGSILVDFLRLHSFKVTLSRNGVDGLKKFKSQNFDMCILDIMMLAEEEMINVFVNILENSLKYSKSNPVIQIMVKNEKSKTIVFFKDNGIGMTKKIKTKIFEKFYRESNGNIHNIKGHGLGLAFV